MMKEVPALDLAALICPSNHCLLLLLALVLVAVLVPALDILSVLHHYGFLLEHSYIEEVDPIHHAFVCRIRQGRSGRVVVFSVPELSVLWHPFREETFRVRQHFWYWHGIKLVDC